MSFEKDFETLRARLLDISDLGSVGALLGWDRSTYLPEGATTARSRHSGLIGRLRHQHATDPELGRLLDRLQGATHLDPDGFEARLLRAARRDHDRATRLPADFVERFARHVNETYSAWTKARPANDFASMIPRLERTLDLSREYAGYFPEFQHPMDVFIDESDEGLNVTRVREIFAQLREALVPLVAQVTAAPEPRTDFLHRHYPQAAQLAFSETIAADFGYDFTRGRQDLTHHPFMTKFSIDDVRITTRVKETDLTECLYSTLHEAGHGMYEQGVNPDYEGTPLARGASSGVHESQSRLWENLVGRSREFWEAYFPRAQAAFPEQLSDVTAHEMHRAVNTVRRSLIRTDADELTYNLHVIIRFELELALHDEQLQVRDLADAWHARYQTDLGVRAPDDRDGVLQDVHWYFSRIGGGFQGYTIGNVLSAQFWDAALKDHPDIPTQITRGEFTTLHHWMRDHIYRHGRALTATEIAERTTGSALNIQPYLRYLRGKYGELYGLNVRA